MATVVHTLRVCMRICPCVCMYMRVSELVSDQEIYDKTNKQTSSKQIKQTQKIQQTYFPHQLD